MKKNKSLIFWFMLPTVLSLLIMYVYPVIRTVLMSFFKVESLTASLDKWQFYGFGNYAKIFGSKSFQVSMQNMLLIWIVGGILTLALAMLFAVILTSGIRGKKFFRAAIYMPNIISAVALATMWIQYIFNFDYGLLNNMVQLLGGSKIKWMGTDLKFWAMTISYIFGSVGYYMLIYISGIEGIPADLYEAATIEGANVFQKFFYITLPLLRGSIRTNLVMWTVSSVGFFIWGRVFDPVNLSSQTVMPLNYMYELVFGSSNAAQAVRNSGIGAAIGVMMAAIVVLVFALTNFIVKNDDVEL